MILFNVFAELYCFLPVNFQKIEVLSGNEKKVNKIRQNFGQHFLETGNEIKNSGKYFLEMAGNE